MRNRFFTFYVVLGSFLLANIASFAQELVKPEDVAQQATKSVQEMTPPMKALGENFDRIQRAKEDKADADNAISAAERALKDARFDLKADKGSQGLLFTEEEIGLISELSQCTTDSEQAEQLFTTMDATIGFDIALVRAARGTAKQRIELLVARLAQVNSEILVAADDKKAHELAESLVPLYQELQTLVKATGIVDSKMAVVGNVTQEQVTEFKAEYAKMLQLQTLVGALVKLEKDLTDRLATDKRSESLLTNKLKDRETELAKTSAELQSTQANVVRLNTEVGDLNCVLQKVRDEISKVSGELDDTKTRAELAAKTSEQKVTTLTANVSDLSQNLGSAKAQIVMLTKERDAANAEIQKLNSVIAQKDSAIAQKDQQFATTVATFQKNVDALTVNKMKLQKEVEIYRKAETLIAQQPGTKFLFKTDEAEALEVLQKYQEEARELVDSKYKSQALKDAESPSKKEAKPFSLLSKEAEEALPPPAGGF